VTGLTYEDMCHLAWREEQLLAADCENCGVPRYECNCLPPYSPVLPPPVEVVAEPLPTRVRKLIAIAMENGWQLNEPGGTFVIRLAKEGHVPFFVRWDIDADCKWRFRGARTAEGQPVGWRELPGHLSEGGNHGTA
jgi:hypothetical protein